MIITAMIETTAFEASPSNSRLTSASESRPGTWLNSPSTTITRIAAKSIRTTSETKRITVKSRSPSTTIIGSVRLMASMR